MKKCLQTIGNDNTIIRLDDQKKITIYYSVCWSPIDDNYLINTAITGQLFLWDTSTCKLLDSFIPGKKDPIVRSDWNTLNPQLLLTSSSEEKAYCYTYSINISY